MGDAAEKDALIIEKVARHLYLTMDQQYDHRFVRWGKAGEHGLGEYDPDMQRRYRRQARQIVAVVRATESTTQPDSTTGGDA